MDGKSDFGKVSDGSSAFENILQSEIMSNGCWEIKKKGLERSKESKKDRINLEKVTIVCTSIVVGMIQTFFASLTY
jgi:hypothetical protein